MKVLRELLGSKKYLTAIFGAAATIAARKGFDLDVELCIAIAGMFGILIGAQGATDVGKEKAKIEAGAATIDKPAGAA